MCFFISATFVRNISHSKNWAKYGQKCITADREDNLQRAAHKLNQIITEYGLTISVQKSKSMAFRGRDPVRTKIVIDNEIIEQVNSFNYLGNMISYEKELDIDNKLHN